MQHTNMLQIPLCDDASFIGQSGIRFVMLVHSCVGNDQMAWVGFNGTDCWQHHLPVVVAAFAVSHQKEYPCGRGKSAISDA